VCEYTWEVKTVGSCIPGQPGKLVSKIKKIDADDTPVILTAWEVNIRRIMV
jgi:hypothetical protein